jgi:hypothetical protein
MGIIGGCMIRCHQCNARFVKFGGSLILTKDLRNACGRLRVLATMAVATALVLGAILWFSHVQSRPAGDSGAIHPAPPESAVILRDA